MAHARGGSDEHWTDFESEGLPAEDVLRPGTDAETADEGRFPPRDHTIAAEDWGTAQEQLVGEPADVRARRERPEAAPRTRPRSPGGRIGEPDDPDADDLVGDWSDDESGTHRRRSGGARRRAGMTAIGGPVRVAP